MRKEMFYTPPPPPPNGWCQKIIRKKNALKTLLHSCEELKTSRQKDYLQWAK